jgi:orotate phosphoribosyltransferase
MTEGEALKIFRKTGALLEGHFVLRSGLHSRQFFQCAIALQKMPIVEQLGEELANRVRDLGVMTVVAPAMGGLVIGQEVARQLGARFVFLEKENGLLVLRRGYTIEANEKILIVEDVVTRGGRVQEAIDIVNKYGGSLRAIAVLVDRSNGTFQPNAPLHSLLQMVVETFEPDNLPEDLRETEAVKPGSN